MLKMKFKTEEDYMEEENWHQFKKDYAETAKPQKLQRALWTFIRKSKKINPERATKTDITKEFIKLNKQYWKKRTKNPNYKPTYREGLAIRMVKTEHEYKDGKVVVSHKVQGAWKEGLYSRTKSLHQARSPTGKIYVKTYQKWTPAQEAVATNPNISLSRKTELLGRTKRSITTKIRRLK